MEPELDLSAAESQTAERLRHFAAVWRGEEPLASDAASIAEVRAGDLVVQGVLRIAPYLLRPVPATGAAARRLRARTFRVGALRELLARRVSERLGLACLIFTGGDFLLAGSAAAGWQETLQSLQREFDAWLFQHLHPAGELQFYLAGAVCQSAQLPCQEICWQLEQRQRQPLEGALRTGLRWNGRVFVLPAGRDTGLCSGCGTVSSVELLGDESLCAGCAADSELCARLLDADRAWLCAEPEADFAGPGWGLKFSQPSDAAAQELPLDAGHWPLLRRIPLVNGQPLGFEALAERATGSRKLLGYLHADVDQAGRAFAALEGDPARTVALSRLLDCFFAEHLRQILESKFPLVFPAGGDGDNMLLIGSWQDTLDLALQLRQDFAALVGDTLTLSAGLAVSAPHAHIRTAAEQAGESAREAKQAGGNRLCALGVVIEWNRAPSLVTTAKALADWLERGAISGSWLKQVTELCASSRNGSQQWRPLLQAIVRNPRVKHSPARAWAARLPGDSEESDRPWMEFLARYATLAAGA